MSSPTTDKRIDPSRKTLLDALYRDYSASFLSSDPLFLVKEFSNPADQEIAAILISSLAFGQVAQIVKAGRAALELMGHSPRRFVENFDPEAEILRWKKWYYRMAKPTDVLRLLHSLKSVLKEHGSMASWVSARYEEGDEHLGQTWARCVSELKSIDRKEWRWRRTRGIGFNHLLADPNKKSACKRAHLMLRWMVRKDGLDLGLWPLPASKLLIPVDTHIQRIAYNIGLTDREDTSLRTAIEITSALKTLDPNDPVKYDFALCRLGILKMCPKKRDLQKCAKCPIVEICRL